MITKKTLVEELLDHQTLTQPHISKYLNKWQSNKNGLDYFFIKNLENVQGDERDVIYISTVHGPSEKGAKVMHRFGPITGINGKRRLNVLFTRSRFQIKTFTSMTSSDITADSIKQPGTWMLKKWLEYSATGILESGEDLKEEPESPFEEHVIELIKSFGYEPVPQVGVGGFRIDIGIRHPKWPHGYIMGIECDGATFHSSKSARDRDRLREEVLTGLGWHLYRIWSTDWFQNTKKEAELLKAAIEKRVNELLSTQK